MMRSPLQAIDELQTLLAAIDRTAKPHHFGLPPSSREIETHQRLYGFKVSQDRFKALLAIVAELQRGLTMELQPNLMVANYLVFTDEAEGQLRRLIAESEAAIAVAQDLALTHGFEFKTKIVTVPQLPKTKRKRKKPLPRKQVEPYLPTVDDGNIPF